MAEISKIAWTRSTFNPWIGCTKVGPGCDHCYAEVMDARYKWGGKTHWGSGVARHRTGASAWSQPITWNGLAAQERKTGDLSIQHVGKWDKPGVWPVFCASLADVFDNEIDRLWRFDLWRLVEATPNLSWLLVTKRVGNVVGMIPVSWEQEFPPNVRILITVCNQEEADRDIPKLLALPCKNGISYEPALEWVDWSPWLGYGIGRSQSDERRLEWIIVGGESNQGGQNAREFNVAWAHSTIMQCKAADVPVFVKQIGSQPRNWCVNRLLSDASDAIDYEPDFCDAFEAHESSRSCDRCAFLKNRAGADPAEWPEDLRVREFP